MTDEFAASPYAPQDADNDESLVEDAAPELPDFSDLYQPEIANQIPVPPLTFWGWLRGRLFGHDLAKAYRQRMANLNRAIEQYPDAAANYLQRGEAYMEARHYTDAAADFRRAIDLANAEYAERSWGVVSQTVRDRALERLEHVERKLY